MIRVTREEDPSLHCYRNSIGYEVRAINLIQHVDDTDYALLIWTPSDLISATIEAHFLDQLFIRWLEERAIIVTDLEQSSKQHPWIQLTSKSIADEHRINIMRISGWLRFKQNTWKLWNAERLVAGLIMSIETLDQLATEYLLERRILEP